MNLENILDHSFVSGITTVNLSAKSDPMIFTDAYFALKYEQISEVVRVFADEYWKKAKRNGFGVNILDDILMLFVILRFLVLTIRYNVKSSLIITASSTAAAWLWYNNFISTLFLYEHALYKNSLTFRLGVDATQIRRAAEGGTDSSDFREGITITNPLGLILYTFRHCTKDGEYRIDPLSMITAQILNADFLPHIVKYQVENMYYLFYRELIPLAAYGLRRVIRMMTGYILYMLIVRVGKKITPYIIRWHWTFVYVVSSIQTYFLYVIQRANEYCILRLHPQIVAAKEFGLYLPKQEFQMKIIYLMCFSFIISHLCFLLFGMFHALIGQYFYIPFFTQNVELHIGKRPKDTIYSGGYTAWQDKEEQPTGFRALFPKLWYGWFGRGTLKPNFIIRLINYFIFDPIYSVIRRIISAIKEFVDWFLWWIR